MDRTRTEAAVVLFQAGTQSRFRPCLGDFKTLGISGVKTVTNITLLAANFDKELRKPTIISGHESRNCDGQLFEFLHFGYEVCDFIGKTDVLHSSNN
jgi:hypothetical protein